MVSTKNMKFRFQESWFGQFWFQVLVQFLDHSVCLFPVWGWGVSSTKLRCAKSRDSIG